MADEPETRFFDVRITAVVAIEETSGPEADTSGRPTPDELVEAVRRHAEDLSLDAMARLRNIFEALQTSGLL